MSATVEEVAEACNLTVRRVNQLAKDGTIPREARGVYDLVECLKAYVRHLQAAVQSRATMDEDGEITSAKDQRSKLLGAQAELAELELAKVRGDSMSVADHYAVMSSLIVETKARVMGIGPRVAPQLVGQDSRVMIQAKIEVESKLALLHLAENTPRLEMPEPAAPPVPQVPEPDTEPKTAPKRKRAAKKKPTRKAKVAAL